METRITMNPMDTRTTLFAAVAGLALTGCGLHFNNGVKGSGKVVTEDRSVSGFTAIEHRGAGDIDVTVGPTTKVTLKTDDNIAKLVQTRVENGKLIIDSTEPISPTEYKVTITVPSLNSFAIDGAGDATLKGIAGEKFSVSIDGAGDIKLSGSAKSAELSIDGAGNIEAFDLKSDEVVASIDGAGSIELTANKKLDASLDGAGGIRYRGNPSVTKKVSGVGSIDKD